jgi:hypothetical protein
VPVVENQEIGNVVNQPVGENAINIENVPQLPVRLVANQEVNNVVNQPENVVNQPVGGNQEIGGNLINIDNNIPIINLNHENIVENQNNNIGREQLLAQIEALQAGIVDSGVDIEGLSQTDRELYDLILEVGQLRTDDQNNKYVKRENDYNFVKKIIDDNPGQPEQAIQNLIDANTALDDTEKREYKMLIEKILKFDGDIRNTEIGGNQNGIGVSHKNSRDVTGVLSLERLKELYGILDGTKAINIVQEMALIAIKQQNIAHNNHAITAMDAAIINPSNDYLDAANLYLESLKIPPEELELHKIAREIDRDAAKEIIDIEVNFGISCVNKHLAAYRALENMENNDAFIYEEEIKGRFNTRDHLAYTIKAILDVKEIKLANIDFEPLDNQQILEVQRKNIQSLLHALAEGQREYNKESINGYVDINHQSYYNNNLITLDVPSCPHGVCSRMVNLILTSALFLLNSSVFRMLV